MTELTPEELEHARHVLIRHISTMVLQAEDAGEGWDEKPETVIEWELEPKHPLTEDDRVFMR
jgi:hypothetical protein